MRMRWVLVAKCMLESWGDQGSAVSAEGPSGRQIDGRKEYLPELASQSCGACGKLLAMPEISVVPCQRYHTDP
jgi:hypothetical protein